MLLHLVLSQVLDRVVKDKDKTVLDWEETKGAREEHNNRIHRLHRHISANQPDRGVLLMADS